MNKMLWFFGLQFFEIQLLLNMLIVLLFGDFFGDRKYCSALL